MAIVDFHGHFLPGLDDGSPDLQSSAEMLRSAAEQQIDVMVATPHFYADSMNIPTFLEKRKQSLCSLQAEIKGWNMKIICGAEVLFFPHMSKAEGLEELCIEGTNVMLLELPFRPWSERDLYVVEGLVKRGIVPIYAHLERYISYQKNSRVIDDLLSIGGYAQINAGSLLKFFNRGKVLQLFKRRTVRILGSDCHNTSTRPVNLMAGREMIMKKLGKDFLEEIDSLTERILKI